MTIQTVRILGAGWYGCAIAHWLGAAGYDIILEDTAGRLFSGASGSNPARLHVGWHYPRSKLTRAACQEHNEQFLSRYRDLTEPVPVNIYAIAAGDSYLDFGTYKQIGGSELPFFEVDPEEYGLANCEGAVQVSERHIVIRKARDFFTELFSDWSNVEVRLASDVASQQREPRTDEAVIDCTFCANDSVRIDRYEPCVVLVMESRGFRRGKAVTVMDGPFSSFYPWDRDLVSLSSAKWTPLSKTCKTYGEAKALLKDKNLITEHVSGMVEQMLRFYPSFTREYEYFQTLLSIRAMPHSGADTRLVDIVQQGERHWRIRAGKIDAVLFAAQAVEELLSGEGSWL